MSMSDFDHGRYEVIDAYVEEQMRRLKIPGVSLAIVEGDRIVHLRGFGRARPGGARAALGPGRFRLEAEGPGLESWRFRRLD